MDLIGGFHGVIHVVHRSESGYMQDVADEMPMGWI